MSDLPQAIREGELKIGHVRLRVYHLDDGRQIIDAEDFAALFDAFESGLKPTGAEVEAITAFLRPSTKEGNA